jgi:hypothetical protein
MKGTQEIHSGLPKMDEQGVKSSRSDEFSSFALALDWEKDTFELSRRRHFTGRSVHWEELFMALLVSLRSTFAVGIACLAYRSTSVQNASSGMGWLAVFYSGMWGSQPAFGAMNMQVPGLAFQLVIIYTCSAIAQSYPWHRLLTKKKKKKNKNKKTKKEDASAFGRDPFRLLLEFGAQLAKRRTNGFG